MSPPADPPRQFSLVLRAAPGVADPAHELQQLLKLALRRHGFKCLLLAAEPHRPAPPLETITPASTPKRSARP
jgi:hypothetical protein